MTGRLTGRRGLTAAVMVMLMPLAACGAGNGEAGAGTAGPGAEQLTLSMGGSQSSSSVFSLITAQARLAGDADGAISINIRETGASSENIQLLRDGTIDFGLSGLSTVVQARDGLSAFEGQAYPEMCNLMNYLRNGEFITVRADMGIDSVEDLEGLAFAPGFQGSALYDNFLAYFAVLGIQVDVFDGSLEDITNAMKDGRIVGFGKSGNAFGADSAMLDVASSVPVKAIGFTREQADRILAADPNNAKLYQFAEVPAGSIYDNAEPFVTSVVISTYFTDDSMPEETAYRLTKSMFESLETAAQQTNYGGAKGITPEDTTSTTGAFPLCAGAQRYFDEVSS